MTLPCIEANVEDFADALVLVILGVASGSRRCWHQSHVSRICCLCSRTSTFPQAPHSPFPGPCIMILWSFAMSNLIPSFCNSSFSQKKADILVCANSSTPAMAFFPNSATNIAVPLPYKLKSVSIFVFMALVGILLLPFIFYHWRREFLPGNDKITRQLSRVLGHLVHIGYRVFRPYRALMFPRTATYSIYCSGFHRNYASPTLGRRRHCGFPLFGMRKTGCPPTGRFVWSVLIFSHQL